MAAPLALDCLLLWPASTWRKWESRALSSFKGTTLSQWFRYVDNTWVKIKTQRVEGIMEDLNSEDCHIQFTRENMKEKRLPFLECALYFEMVRGLNVELYQKPTPTYQHLLVNSHHYLEHKLGVIRTLHHRAENIPTKTEGKAIEHKHIKTALNACGHSRSNNQTMQEEERNKCHNIVIPYVAGISEKLHEFSLSRTSQFTSETATLLDRN